MTDVFHVTIAFITVLTAVKTAGNFITAAANFWGYFVLGFADIIHVFEVYSGTLVCIS
jgi:hypothetical protein